MHPHTHSHTNTHCILCCPRAHMGHDVWRLNLGVMARGPVQRCPLLWLMSRATDPARETEAAVSPPQSGSSFHPRFLTGWSDKVRSCLWLKSARHGLIMFGVPSSDPNGTLPQSFKLHSCSLYCNGDLRGSNTASETLWRTWLHHPVQLSVMFSKC